MATLILATGSALAFLLLEWRPSTERDRPTGRPSDSPPAGVQRKEPLGPAYASDASARVICDEAQRLAEEVASAYPESPNALAVAAHFCHVEGQSDKEVAIWQRCLAIDPNCAEAHYGIGVIALRSGDYAQAVLALQKAASIDPDDLRVPGTLAEALVGLERYDEALEMLEATSRRGKVSVDVMASLGQAYLRRGEPDKAYKTFSLLVEQVATDPRGHYGLARACVKMGRQDEAQQHMNHFKALDSARLQQEIQQAQAYSDEAAARGLLVQILVAAARVYQGHGDPIRSESMWRRSVHVDERNIDGWTELLKLYGAAGRDHDALAVSRKLAELEPDNPDHWYNIALLSGRFEEYDAALQAAARAVSLDPRNQRYLDILRRLEKAR